MKVFLLIILFSPSFLKAACLNNRNIDFQENEYAKGFSLGKFQDSTIIRLNQKVSPLPNMFILSSKSGKFDHFHKCENIIVLDRSIQKIIISSSSHIYPLEALGKLSHVVGASNKKSFYNRELRNKEVKEIGHVPNPEKVLKLKPDVVFSYSVSRLEREQWHKTSRLGVPVIDVSEFKEDHPLGRVEWLKFFGVLLGKTSQANEKYDSIKSEYKKFKENIIVDSGGPKIMVGSFYNGQWMSPGPKSFMATVLSDAGAELVWLKDKNQTLQTMGMEEALISLKKADFWLPHNNWRSREELLKFDTRLKSLELVKNRKVYNFVKRIDSKGRNEFWEQALWRPDLLLKEFNILFQPKEALKKKLKWYRQLK